MKNGIGREEREVREMERGMTERKGTWYLIGTSFSLFQPWIRCRYAYTVTLLGLRRLFRLANMNNSRKNLNGELQNLP